MSKFSSLIMYISFFSLSSFFIGIAQGFKKGTKTSYMPFVILGISIPVAISGLRYSVGTDFFTYIMMFNRLSSTSFREFLKHKDFEWGFYIIQKAAGWLGNYKMMFFLCAVITIIFIYLAIVQHRGKISIGLSFVLYLFIYFPGSFNIVRQHIALAIVVYSFRYIFKKNFKKFLLFSILASSFHLSALIIIPFYFVVPYESKLSIKKLTRKDFIRFLIIIACVIFAINFSYFIETISQVDPLEKYASYALSDSRAQNREIFLKVLILIPILMFRKKLINHDKRNEVYIFFLVLDIIFTLTGFITPFVKRLGIYFAISQIFLLASIPKVLSNKGDKLITSLIIFIYALTYFILVFYILNQAHVIPYQLNL